MIGCLIAGGLLVFALGRVMHARRWYHWHHGHHGWGGCRTRHWGGHHGGPWGHFSGRRGWGDYGIDDGDEHGGASFRGDEFGPEGWEGSVRGKRFFIRSVLSRVHATPEQERAIGTAFEEFRGQYDYVVVVGPRLDRLPEVISLSSAVDQTLLVVPRGAQAWRLRQLLPPEGDIAGRVTGALILNRG